MASRFPRPPMVPPAQPTLGSATVTREVRSFAELQAAIAAAVARPDRGTDILIVKSFALAETVTIPAALAGCSLRSLPGVTLMATGVTTAIDVVGLPFRARDLHLVGSQAGSPTTTGIQCSVVLTATGPDHLFEIRDCEIVDFDEPIDCVLGTGSSYLVVSIVGCTFDGTTPTLQVGGLAPLVAHNQCGNNIHGFNISTVTTNARVIGNNLGLGSLTIGAGGATAAILGNRSGFGTIDTSASDGGHRLFANDFPTHTLHATDVDLDADVTGAATLNSADPTLTVGRSEYIRVTFGAGASGNVSLTNGHANGQRLTLFCVSYAGTATIPDATAQNVKLSAAWTPDADDTLTLFWDQTDSNWVELSRSAN